MKTKLKVIVFFATFVVGIGLSMNAWADKPWPNDKPKSHTIYFQPESQIVELNGFVGFAVRVQPSTVAKYQWSHNGNVLKGETKRELYIDHAAVTNVGYYTVEVTWQGFPPTNSSKAFLSVYSLKQQGNALSGTLTVSTDQFVTGSSSFKCPDPSIDLPGKLYEPVDGAEKKPNPFYFFGPFVSLGDTNGPFQIGPFVNWPHNYNLRIDMISQNNANAKLGLQLILDTGSNVAKACQVGDGVNGPLIELPLATDDDAKKARYRVFLFYNDPDAGPAKRTLELNWTYY